MLCMACQHACKDSQHCSINNVHTGHNSCQHLHKCASACCAIVQVVWDKIDWIVNAFGLMPWYARRDDNTMVCTS